MGYNLVNEVLNHAPKNLTPKEMVAALAFAADANDKTRLTWNSIEDPMFLRQLRVGRARLYELLEALVTKGVLALASAGHRHGCAKYRFVDLTAAKCPEDLDTETSPKCPETPDTGNGSSVRESRTSSVQAPRTLKHDQCPEDPDISVRESRTPTNQDQSLSTTTNQDPNPLSAAAAAREASRIDAVPDEREFEQPQKQDQPQERQPQQGPHVADVAAAYTKARAEIGKPATPLERARIRISADELVQAGQSIEYLIRLAAWMGTEHPGWVDLARARTADGSPALIPRQRDDKNDGPCQEGACDGHDHLPCERGWIKLPTGLAHCPCSPMSKLRSAPGHQTWQDPDSSTYRSPKREHVGWQNPTDPDAYEGTF